MMEIYKINSFDFQKKIEPEKDEIKITFGQQRAGSQRLCLFWNKSGVATRMFFICPLCGRHAQNLYRRPADRLYSCRACAGVNTYAGIQNMTKGGAYEIEYRMRRFADRRHIQFHLPFDYRDFLHDPRAGGEDFAQQLKILQALENMRFGANFFGLKYKPAVFRSVLDGTHPLMQICTTYDLRTYVYNWNTNKGIGENERIQV